MGVSKFAVNNNSDLSTANGAGLGLTFTINYLGGSSPSQNLTYSLGASGGVTFDNGKSTVSHNVVTGDDDNSSVPDTIVLQNGTSSMVAITVALDDGIHSDVMAVDYRAAVATARALTGNTLPVAFGLIASDTGGKKKKPLRKAPPAKPSKTDVHETTPKKASRKGPGK